MEIMLFGKTDLGPATKLLVEKISSAIGTAYAPFDKVFHALADVTVDKIKAAGAIETEGVRRRALERLAAEETKKQQNLEAVYGKTFQLTDPNIDEVKVQQLDDDWIVYHSQKARLVSDAEMQTLWARVLASEVETPGSYSKRALETLSVLEKQEAHLFTSVCRFNVRVDSEQHPAILYSEGLLSGPPPGLLSFYTELGLNDEKLIHLATIGLLHYTWPLLSNHVWDYESPIVDIEYFGDHRKFQVGNRHATSGKFLINYGAVGLTKVGQELARIAGEEPVPGFFDFLERQWMLKSILRAPPN